LLLLILYNNPSGSSNKELLAAKNKNRKSRIGVVD